MKTFRDIVGEGIGEASMCWSETPKGIFDSTRASEIFDRILNAADIRILWLESDEQTKYVTRLYSELSPENRTKIDNLMSALIECRKEDSK